MGAALGKAASTVDGGTALPAVEDLLRSLVVACTTAMAAALAEGGHVPLESSIGSGEGLSPHINALAGAVSTCLGSFHGRIAWSWP